MTDALGRSVGYSYDAAGRMTAQTMPDGRVVHFAYDSNGNMTAITPPSRPAHGFTFDRINQETEYNPPDVGLPVDVTRYEYNLDGDLTKALRPDGLAINYNYDSAGRLASILAPTARYDYTYGVNGCTSCGGNDLPSAIARTDAATGAVESMSFAYDGSIPTGITFAGTVNGSINWTFNNNFWITSESVNGVAVNYGYDNDGRLISAGALTLTRNTQNGFLTGTALGTITDAYTYSIFGEMSNYTAKVGATALFNVAYVRDAIGRITKKTETIGGSTTVYEYSYDTAGRLIAVKEGGVTVSTYDYDANGNRITAVTRAGTFQGFYDLQDRMTKYGDADYAYTANGELTSKTDSAGVTSYSYDVFGNLRGVTMPNGDAIEYIIDARNRRIGKKLNGALTQGFIYKDQLESVAELDGAGNVVSTFIYASKGHVPDYMVKGGVTYRILSDHLGSVRLVINTSDGSIAQRIDYDEFGNIIQDTAPGFQPFAFVGGIYDQHTKHTRFGARDYDAFTGRWTAKDPIGFAAVGINLYEHAFSDAINYYDISGMEPNSTCVNAFTAAGAAVGGLLGGNVGGTAGAGVGTCMVPIAGTAAGAISGGALGALAGGALGGGAGNATGRVLCPEECPPCIPPVGTLAYRFDMYPSRPHLGVLPHYHVYIMQQNPKNCQCFWQPLWDGPGLPPWWMPPIGPAK